VARVPQLNARSETLEDVHAAIAHYVNSIPYDQIISTATHISTDINYRLVGDSEMAAALARRSQAGSAERDIYASYINEAFLTALERHADRIVFQFSLGAEPLPYETSSRLSQTTIAQLAEMIGRTRACASNVSWPTATRINPSALWRANCPTSAWLAIGGITFSLTRSGS